LSNISVFAHFEWYFANMLQLISGLRLMVM